MSWVFWLVDLGLIACFSVAYCGLFLWCLEVCFVRSGLCFA